MRKLSVLACTAVFVFVFIATAAADTKITFKKGDEVYVCGCGENVPVRPCRKNRVNADAEKTWSKQRSIKW